MRKASLGLAAALAVLVACGGDGPTDPSAPSPGLLKIVLTTPNVDDGALLLTVSGGVVSTVDAAAPGYQLYTARPDSMTLRVLITGDIAAGPVIRIHVADTHKANAYHANIAQVASRSTFVQRLLTGYALAVAP